ncbi:hypothetical protein B7463_g10733, partial [Scytalidium lignicola]
MKSFTAAVVLSIAALANAQGFTTDPTTGAITCGIANATYCSGGPIIIRCTGTTGHPGNCNDNLVGEPPVGNSGTAECWTPGPNTGLAACEKNGIVYGSSGNVNGTFPVPSGNSTAPSQTSSTIAVGGTTTSTFGTAVASGTGAPGPIANGTSAPGGGSGTGSGGSPTNTPVGPSGTSTPPQETGNSAVANRAGSALAAVGLLAAYLL